VDKQHQELENFKCNLNFYKKKYRASQAKITNISMETVNFHQGPNLHSFKLRSSRKGHLELA